MERNERGPHDEADMQCFRRLMEAHERLLSEAASDRSTWLGSVGILEEMHELIHQRRVPLHADRGYCSHGLLQLYVRLKLWDRYVDWIRMRRDLEEDVDRKLAWTSNMLRLAERHPEIVATLQPHVIGFDLEPDAPAGERARLLHMKSRASYRLWQASQDDGRLEQAIRWAERACETGETAEHRAGLEQLLRVEKEHFRSR
ncbi:MAG: hypothetical protein IPK82_17690 [Polyangiaceae bacterium]|nr:hypothetical protein [Polyangiaceae bacterium]